MNYCRSAVLYTSCTPDLNIRGTAGGFHRTNPLAGLRSQAVSRNAQRAGCLPVSGMHLGRISGFFLMYLRWLKNMLVFIDLSNV